ncbi:DUF2157 domain-containing protein [Marinicauda salina]|nr:DUF2157 domain-containing protein [Marinicauda salina]
MDGYRKRLARDLERWIAQGLVDPANRQAILDSASSGRPAWSATGAAAILGAVLLGLAAITFVAANWAEMARALRFGVILAALWAAFAGAAAAFARDRDAVGHALALLGAALFGAAITLTAQTFNMSAFRNTGVLIWTGGALATALVLPSRPVLILAALLGAAWAVLESVNPYAPDILWSYLAVWALTAAAATRMHSLVSWTLLAIGLFVWLGFTMKSFVDAGALFELEAFALYALIAAAIALAASALREARLAGAGVLSNWAAIAGLLAGWALQFPIAAYVRTVERAERADWLDPGTRWAEVFGPESGAFLVPALVAGGVILACGLYARARGRLETSALAAVLAATAFLIALPFIARAAGPEAVAALRIGIGAAVYAVAVGLILQGARGERRVIGGIGVAAFILQSIYVYATLFGDLLDTAVFFLVGGALLLGLAFAAARWRGRRQAGGGS